MWSPFLRFAQATPFDREVVALRAAARKNDFRRLCTDKRGDLRPRLFDGRTGILAETVETRRVAEQFAEKGLHRRNHPLIGRRRRRIIHIDRMHHLLPNRAPF